MQISFPNFLKFLFLIISATTLQSGCAIQPTIWQPPTKPAFTGAISLNEKLANVKQINLGGWHGPEEFAFDAQGNMYCGVHKAKKRFTTGAILKISPTGEIEEFLHTDTWVTGLQFDHSGRLVALINNVGLVRIDSTKQMEVLVSKDTEGRRILMGTGLKIASDGKIYFANISSTATTTPKYISRLFLELKPTGGLYCYDPKTKVTTTLSAGNYFANGIALANDESYLLLSETSKYRVLKYWLKGEKAGKTEVFLDNLAGFPNNISRRNNGNFWIGFTTKRNDALDKIHPKTGLKKLVYGLPSFVQPKAEKFGMIIEYSPLGEVVQALFDPTGESVMEAGAVKEYQNQLYIGGDVVSYIGKYHLGQ